MIKSIVLICLLASLPPLPVVRKFKKPVEKASAQQLMFKSLIVRPPYVIYIPFNYPSNFNTNIGWYLLASSNLNNWFIVTNGYTITNGALIVSNKYPQMYFRIWQ